MSSASRRLFRSTCLPTVSPADLLAELDPRSLDPDRSFWSAFAELIWDRNAAYRLLQLHYSTCGQPNRIWTLLVLAGTETLISFLFFLTTLLLRAVVSGELRFSVRSFPPQCWFFPVAQVCPTVMRARSPRHRDLRRDA